MSRSSNCRSGTGYWATPVWAMWGAVTVNASATQYDVAILDSGGYQVYAIDHGNAVGYDHTGRPTIWSNGGRDVTYLPTPTGFVQFPRAVAISGDEVVGSGALALPHQPGPYPILWSGPNHTSVNLYPSPPGGVASAVYDGVQVGVAGSGAALWRGTAGSYVNLSPTELFYAIPTGIWGNEVSGLWTGGGFDYHAAMWTSLSASAFVNLNGSYTNSDALAISRGQVVGWVGTAGTHHAAIWTNGAASLVDLSPAGTTASELRATNGVQQVGYVSRKPGLDGGLPTDTHAVVWNGTASSYQLLPIPQQFGFDVNSIATGIDGNGDIVGQWGNGLLLEWIPHHFPGDVNFDGNVDFDDLEILSQYYGQAGEWVDGEFSGGGTVNFTDLLTLAQHYGQSQAAVEYSMVAVPEPTSAAVILLAGGGLGVTRRRSCQ